MSRLICVALAVTVFALALAGGTVLASGGSGGSGGGGGGGGSTYVLQGYISDLDPIHSTLTIGTSYYNIGTAIITGDTRVTRNGVNCTANDLELGDFASVRVNFATGVATKIEAVGP
jgi:hypothetical protein